LTVVSPVVRVLGVEPISVTVAAIVAAVAANAASPTAWRTPRRDEGLTAIEEAVSVYRRLAAADPAAYEPALAMSLNNLSLRLADAGRRDEGLTAIEEAVGVRRRLAAANPAAYEPELAISLNNAIRPTMTPVATAVHVQSPSSMYMSSAISATSPPIITQTLSHLRTTPGTRLHMAAITAL